MGIGYVDSVVAYNRYINGLYETEQYFGTWCDNVRIELTHGSNPKEDYSDRKGIERVSVFMPGNKEP